MKKRLFMVLLCLCFFACGVFVGLKGRNYRGSAKEPDIAESGLLEGDVGTLLVTDDENYTFLIESAETTESGDYVLQCHLENKTDGALTFALNNIQINSLDAKMVWEAKIGANKSLEKEILIPKEEFERYNIGVIKDIQFALTVYDAKNPDLDQYCDEIFVYNPK